MSDYIEKLSELIIKLHVHLENNELTDQEVEDKIDQILLVLKEIEELNYFT